MNRTVFVVGACASVLLTGCSSNPDDAMKKDADVSIITCEDAVKKQLKDPGSAQFDDEAILNKDKITAASTSWKVNGSVNAKNAFGGYTGKKLWTCTVTPNADGNGNHSAHAEIIDLSGLGK